MVIEAGTRERYTRYEQLQMRQDDLAELISHLSSDDQAAVRDFILFLRGQKETDSPFLSAIEEFIEKHPELLRRLAQ
jgi:hypothetical protein